ncbi:MFS transporter [Halorhodospira neutriphila]|uniref:MFS transporter n=1 Tax=Halorhodospira neutriphila TaxID=168379 RepID=A0ABS1E407_9GAMM|nr:MFS transporter [Halorhodospira neutriphila]MBK1726468.1 MFS transporter [Halorhodospira neutriphila]
MPFRSSSSQSAQPISATTYAALGAGLIAVAYGLARFAFGLFVPPIREELGLSAEVMGFIGAQPFISFVFASLFASAVAERLGARAATVLSGAFAVAGLTLISQAEGPLVLGAGVFACGLCTGTMMPALNTGLHAAVRPTLHGRVNAVMNAGTSLGVALAVPAVLLLAGAWREAYAAFALLAALGAAAAWALLPASAAADREAPATPPARLPAQQRRRVIELCLFSAAMGGVSSAYWVFAPDLVVALGGLEPHLSGWLWLAVGVAGLAGAAAGDWADRHGAGVTQAVALATLAAGLLLLIAAPSQLMLAIASAALFGVAYMTLTAVYLISGIRLLPHRPSLGAVLPFLAIAVGQAIGSPLAGWAVERFGYTGAFAAFAGLGLAAAACWPLFPSSGPAAQAASAAGPSEPDPPRRGDG